MSQLPKLELDQIEGGESLLGVSDGHGYQVSLETVKEYVGGGGSGGSNVDLKNVKSDVLPSVNDSYDLGSSGKSWKNLHVVRTIQLGRGSVTARLSSMVDETFTFDVPLEMPDKVGSVSRVMTESDMYEYPKRSELPTDTASKTYVRQQVSNIVGEATTNYDTLEKIEARIRANSSAIAGKISKSTADAYYLGKSAQAADSAKLGGIAASEFVLSSELPVVPSLDGYYTGAQVDSKINALESKILGGASGAYDTLKEIETILEKNKGEIGSLLTVIDEYSSKFQGQIDGLWSRNSFEELILGHAAADTIAVGEMTVDKINGGTPVTSAVLGSHLGYINGALDVLDYVSMTDVNKQVSDVKSWVGTNYATGASVVTLEGRMTLFEENYVHKDYFKSYTERIELNEKDIADLESKYNGFNQEFVDVIVDLEARKANKSYVDSNFVSNDRASNFAEYGQFLNINNGTITINGASIKPLTSHQTLYSLTLKDSAGKELFSYDPKTELSGGYVYQLTKANVGLGDVENTKLSTWKGTANITTLGTITSGTWNGSEIGQSYLDLSGYAKSSDLGAYQTKITSDHKLSSSLVSGLGAASGYGVSEGDFTASDGKLVVGAAVYSHVTNRLKGYATQSWVEGKNYLTGITSAQVTGALGYTPTSLTENDLINKGFVLSTALANYLPLMGGTIKGNLTVDGIFSLTGYINTRYHYLFVRDNDNADWVVTNKSWTKEYNLIHSGNIGSQTVAAANKLSTDITIWGKSFDGSGDVSGDLSGVGSITRSFEYAVDSDIAGNLKFKRNDSTWSIISSSGSYYLTVNASLGNVGIGTTNPTRKLHVNDTSGIPAVLQSNQPSTALGFSQKDGGVAYLTYSGGDTWRVTNNSWGREYKIIHSGNYEEYTVHINAFEGALTRLTQVETIAGNNKSSIEDLWPEFDAVRFYTIPSLQGQIDGLWARNSFDELYATHVMSDTLAVEEMFTDKLTIGNAPIEYVVHEGLKLSTAIYIDGSSVALSNQLPTTTQKNNWNTAYSWGNHASAGYTKLKSKDGYTFLSVTGGVESEAGWALRIGTDFFLSSVQSAVYADYYSGSVYLGTPNYRWLSVYALSYDQSSDATLKDVLGDTSLTLSQIANAPAVSFTWKYNGKKDVGTLAQYWKDVLPEIVSGEEGNMGMNYAALGVVSSIILARNVETHEQRIERLERENEELRKEILTLKNR